MTIRHKIGKQKVLRTVGISMSLLNVIYESLINYHYIERMDFYYSLSSVFVLVYMFLLAEQQMQKNNVV